MGREGVSGTTIGCAVVGVATALLAIMFMVAGTANIDAGHVGLVKNWGATSNDTWGPGFHLKLPFQQEVIAIDIRTQRHPFTEAAAASKELQNVYVDGAVNYSISPSKAVSLYNTVGLDYASKVFDPAFQDYLKEVVPTYPVTDILSHREEIRGKVKAKLAETARTYGIDVIDVFITQIHFDKTYEAAIAAKQVSQQQLEQAKIDAQKAVTTAQGNASAQVEQAKGDAQANALRSQNLSPDLINYLAVQKWNGTLPQVTGGTPFINFTAK